MLYLLEKELRKQDYLVLSLSFEAADEYFESLGSLAEGLSLDIEECLREQNVDEKVLEEWNHSISERFPMRSLGTKISNLCRKCGKKVVLMIDEVDKSSDNQIFLSFLGLLREKYLKCQQGKDVTFHSVILAGVYDIKTLKLKLHPQEESKYNSPWNIAVDFNIEMSFSVSDIQTMIQEYEQEHRTGMDVKEISRILYDYTSGKNPLRMSFERYVLSAYFEQILEFANIELLKMTQGRFALYRKKDVKGVKQQGLDLSVLDYETGMMRDIQSLSGGESFKAALSLALGLSSMIQNYAGGIELNTLFIDEGFGTLDHESIDQALSVLMDLKNDHKTIGIISHVDELKERIDTQIIVEKGQQGSSLHIERG